MAVFTALSFDEDFELELNDSSSFVNNNNELSSKLALLTSPDGSSLLKNYQINNLGDLKVSVGQTFVPLFTLDNTNLLYQIISEILKFGFDEIYSFLQETIQQVNNMNLTINEKRQFIAIKIPSLEESRNLVRKKEDIFKTNVSATEGLYQCPKSNCRSNRTTFTMAQIRSGDEPLATKITCNVCGHHWID